MGSSVHQTLYEKAMDQLEDLVDAEPDYESESDAEFIEALSENSPSGFTTAEVSRIAKLHGKYCGD